MIKLPEPVRRVLKDLFPGPQKHDLTVVLHNARETAQVARCIRALDAASERLSVEIMVLISRAAPLAAADLGVDRPVSMLPAADAAHPAGNLNAAASKAAGSHILFCDADLVVSHGLLDSAVALMVQDTRVSLVTAKIVNANHQTLCAELGLNRNGAPVPMTAGRQRIEAGDPGAERRSSAVFPGFFFVSAEDFFRLGMFSTEYDAFSTCCTHLCLGAREYGKGGVFTPILEVLLEQEASGLLEPGTLSDRDQSLLLTNWGAQLEKLARVRAIAFYLPQYHPIPQNDAWWGTGFTEWRKVTQAKPNFAGHYQPHQPADLGFYDLRLPEIQEQQAQLARRYGIHGFCYYYYWFDGERLLDRPLQQMLRSGMPNFPFCICWANENWTRRWDGREDDLLMRQTYRDGFDLELMQDLIPAFRDARYIRIDGRPLFLVYRIELLPDIEKTVSRWRKVCREAGVGNPYIACVQSFTLDINPLDVGIDAAVEFPPLLMGQPRDPPEGMLNPCFQGYFFDYEATMRRFLGRREPDYPLFRGAMPSWDNTARQQDRGSIFLGASPDLFKHWVREILRLTRDRPVGDERILFINAWNEWAEGNHLEPDLEYGHAFLSALHDALKALPDTHERG